MLEEREQKRETVKKETAAPGHRTVMPAARESHKKIYLFQFSLSFYEKKRNAVRVREILINMPTNPGGMGIKKPVTIPNIFS